MATIGRSRAIGQIGRLKFQGFTAWLLWLIVHIYYLTGFKNRLFVVMQWAWSYLTFRRGARLIVNKEWRQELPASDQQERRDATFGSVPTAQSRPSSTVK
jgi:NADH dehydrogenase